MLKARFFFISIFVDFTCVHIFLLCHYSIHVEGNSSSQFSRSENEKELRSLFSEGTSLSPEYPSTGYADENEEYYYDGDDDPYGIGDEESNGSLGEDDYSYDDLDGNDFSSKSGRKIKKIYCVFGNKLDNSFPVHQFNIDGFS